MTFLCSWHQHLGDLALQNVAVADRVLTCLFDDERHGDALVKTAKLTLGALLICGVDVYAPIKQCSVDVSNHGADVAGTVRLSVYAFLEGINGVFDGLIPVIEVSLVAGVDPLPAVLREGHVPPRVHELPDGRVEAEALNGASLEGEDELHRRGISAVAGTDAVGARAEQVVHGAVFFLVHGEDGANRDVAVDVGRTIEWVKGDTELPRLRWGHQDWVLILLRDKHVAYAAVHQRVDHHVVGHDVQLLLVVASGVYLTAKSAGRLL